ncbi:YqaJ viral recombinase family nuclease [Halobacillus sp. H74]|uniref:YqaJ viral recombinase family nuclease n=1 Tax=Halobacillus sp. H74 TaxID=3457436 RepID=UPI003FCD1581
MKTHAKKLVHTKDLSRQDWLEWRQKGIGGSDAASISQLNKYSSPWQVYLDKVEEVIDEGGFISEAAEWGTRLEDLIRNKFKENHPELKVRRDFIMWQHPEHPFMLANVDGVLYDPEKGWGVLEVKSANEFKKDDWNDEVVPEEYLIQMQHYLAVKGWNWGWFAVLIGGNKYREFYIERDEELIESLVLIEEDFWMNNVVARVAPEPDGSSSSKEILERLYPGEDVYEKEIVKDLPAEAEELIEKFDEYKQSLKTMENEFNEVKNKLMKLMGEHQVGSIGERKVNWSVTRSFNEKELKKEKPELYQEFLTETLDKKELKKKHKDIYENYMLPKSRSLTVK